jgi:hypothetical protein
MALICRVDLSESIVRAGVHSLFGLCAAIMRVSTRKGESMKVSQCALLCMVLVASSLLATRPAYTADSLEGQVLGGGAPIANSTVTLWAAGAGEPQQLAQARTGVDGHFAMTVPDSRSADTVLYLVAKGGHNPQPTRQAGHNAINDAASDCYWGAAEQVAPH